MEDRERYQTREQDKYHLSTLKDWPLARVKRVELSNPHSRSYKGMTIYVIECEPGKYLREDGCIR